MTVLSEHLLNKLIGIYEFTIKFMPNTYALKEKYLPALKVYTEISAICQHP